VFCYASPALAGSDIGIGTGAQADVPLAFQVIIPEIIFFSIDTDTLVFDVQPGDIDASGNINMSENVLVTLLSNSADNVQIQSDNPSALSGSGTNTLAWENFSVSSGGLIVAPGNGGGYIHNNTSNFSGPVYASGETWTYTLNLDGDDVAAGVAADTYNGTLTYTVTTP
jgi:hypothetical protein